MVFYRLRVPCARGFLDCVESVMAETGARAGADQ
jgi:hypothetical protein